MADDDDTPLVELENVVLRFGPKTVLDGIDLAVRRQERLVVEPSCGPFVVIREFWTT